MSDNLEYDDSYKPPSTLSTAEIFVIFFTKSFLPEVADLVGSETTVKLISVFGGLDLALPARKDFLKVLRNVCIYIGFNNGVSITQLAHQYKLSQQRTGQIYRETRAQIDAYYNLKKQGKTLIKLSETKSQSLVEVVQSITEGNEPNLDLSELEKESEEC